MNLGINAAQSDSAANQMSTGATHSSLLQPLSMQNLLAMACIGQSLNPTVSSQTLPTAQLNGASSLCKTLLNFIKKYRFSILFCIYTGSVQDYGASLPQYANGLYAPASIASATLNTAASVVAGKQIEGYFFLN